MDFLEVVYLEDFLGKRLLYVDVEVGGILFAFTGSADIALDEDILQVAVL